VGQAGWSVCGKQRSGKGSEDLGRYVVCPYHISETPAYRRLKKMFNLLILNRTLPDYDSEKLMLELAADDPLIKAYLKDIQHLKDQFVVHELGLKAPFHNLLDKSREKARLDACSRAFDLLGRQASRARRDCPGRVPSGARVVGG
jgi:hypothetical protein